MQQDPSTAADSKIPGFKSNRNHIERVQNKYSMKEIYEIGGIKLYSFKKKRVEIPDNVIIKFIDSMFYRCDSILRNLNSNQELIPLDLFFTTANAHILY